MKFHPGNSQANVRAKSLKVGGWLLLLTCFLVGCASQQSLMFKDKDFAGYQRLQVLADRYLPFMDENNIALYQIHILDSEVSTPWVTKDLDSDYWLFFTTGALALLNDDELAFLFCHEVARRVQRHYQKELAVLGGVSLGMFLGGFLLPGIGLADGFVKSEVREALIKEQILEADRIAIQVVVANGVDRKSCVSAIRKLYLPAESETAFGFSTIAFVNERITRLILAYVLPPYEGK